MKPRTVTRVLTLITFFLTSILVSAQNDNGAAIIGRIIDTNNTPIPNAMLVVLGDNGETNGTITHDDGTFKLTTTLGSKKITISCLGYAKRFIEKEITGSMDLGDICLNLNEVGLSEVIVQGSRPRSRIDGDGLLTTISGTELSKIGTAKEVLGFLPGVINNNGAIEIFGKGKPIIYINGRLVRNSIELEQLKSEKIKQIKVISNPGARYSADTKGVIRITTVKELGDGFALDSKTTFGYRDNFFHNEQLGLNYRTGQLDLFALFMHRKNQVKGSSTNLQNSWLVHHQKSEVSIASENQSRRLNAQVGFNYTIADKHSFGLYYQTDYTPSKSWLNSQSTFHTDGVQIGASLLEELRKGQLNEHLVDGYYSGQWSDWTADLMFNALWRNSHSDQNLKLHNEGNNQKDSELTDDYASRVYAVEFHLSRPLWRGTISIGTEYTNTSREDDFAGNNLIIDKNNLIKEDNTGLYAQLMQRFGNVTLQLGLRYEHTDGFYYEDGVKIEEQSRKYDKLLPSATLIFPIKQVMFQLGYSRKYNRPLYSQLSSTITYTNQYLYETGNPLLKTPYTDEVSLNMRYKWLIFMASYRNISNPIITTFTNYGNNLEITLLKKDNSPNNIHNFQMMTSIMPGMIGGFYYPVLSLGVVSQFYNIVYRGGKMSMNRPMGIIQINNMFHLPKDYMINSLFRWRGAGDGENVRMGKSWQIDLALSKTFNKHWDVKLSFNDIFNTASHNSFTIYGSNRDIQIDKIVNTRCVELKVGYKFNTTKSKYRGKGAGNTEKNRL